MQPVPDDPFRVSYAGSLLAWSDLSWRPIAREIAARSAVSGFVRVSCPCCSTEQTIPLLLCLVRHVHHRDVAFVLYRTLSRVRHRFCVTDLGYCALALVAPSQPSFEHPQEWEWMKRAEKVVKSIAMTCRTVQ